jgi:ATP diphosphatase
MANESRTGNRENESVLDGMPPVTNELQRGLLLQRRAAEVGFDWAEPEPVLDKFREEIAELQAAMATGEHSQVEDELGDVLFVVVNLARQLGVDPTAALRRANAKFEQRFRALERLAGTRQLLNRMTLDEMEALWQRVKAGRGK